MEFNIDNILQAQKRIENYIVKTPLIRMNNLDEFLGFEVYLKLENMQKTGSFKYRGAMNKILYLPKEKLENGVVCASSGNHGKAIAYAAKELGIPAIVVIPDITPKVKVDNILNLGAKVIQCDPKDRFKLAKEISNEKNMTEILPFDDYEIMAGQGTTGLEILSSNIDFDYVIVPVSGGGLIGGISTAIKEKNSAAKIIGAESKNIARYTVSLKANKRSTVEFKKTVADALVSATPGEKNYRQVVKYVDGFMDVSEEYILKGMKLLLMEGKILSEISSAIGIGGILENKIKIEKNKKVCFVISGGSISLSQLNLLENIDY
ncbi:Pyridoxal-5'-phosphate-dependent protein beta subunit [Peptoniphilus sp. ING2-D1G]|nr:Pyridoxal-5'-phosphate-dependent protein beta subunit [Peptoniphilus sp. ING2-D1G]